MKIIILVNAIHFNCHWYSTKAGLMFDVNRIDEKTNCYIVKINAQDYYVSKNHAKEITP